MIEQFAMIKILKKISINFLNKKQKHKIIYLSFYSLLIPFLEIISIASVSGLVLVFIDFEASIKIIPSIDIQNKLIIELLKDNKQHELFLELFKDNKEIKAKF